MATVSFEDAIASLRSMFPSFDQGVIEAVLEMNRGAMEPTVEQLLTMDPDQGAGSLGLQRPPNNVGPAAPPASIGVGVPVTEPSGRIGPSSSAAQTSSGGTSRRQRRQLPPDFLVLPSEIVTVAAMYGAGVPPPGVSGASARPAAAPSAGMLQAPAFHPTTGQPMNQLEHTKGHQAGVTWVGWLPPQAGVGATAAHSRPTATLLSGSQDGTIRMWDLTNGKKIFEELCCSDVIKFKSVRGVKCGVTCAAVEPPLSGVGGQQQGARFVVAGLEDGSIHVVHFKAPGFRYTRSDVTLRDAHGQRGTEEGGGGGAGITCLAFSPDGSLLASRGMDGCVRVWRVYKEGTACTLALTDKSAPLASISGLASTHDSANVAWSPDGRLLLVGTSVQGTARPGAGEGEASVQTAPGCVVVLDVASSESACSRGGSGSSEGGKTAEGVVVPADKVAVFKVSLAERTTAVQVAWHPKLNQIAVSCSTGLVKVLYSPSLSVKGALLSSARAVKSRDSAADYYAAESVGTIYLPNALPMFSEDAGPLRGPSKKQRAEEMARTAVPPSGGGAGPAKPVDLAAPLPGAVPEYLTHAKRTFTEYFMQHAVKEGPGSERNLRAEDPQVVLTQYAARSAGAASHGGAPEVALYTRVYAATQPQAVLATKTLEEERDEWERAKAARLKAAQGGQQK